VEGCAHGCNFPCYAMMMKRRCGTVKTYNEWIQPKLVTNSLELLEKEIPKYKNQIKFVHLCFSTDPFMYKYPEVSALTLKIIERLNKANIRCTVLTKGIYPTVLTNTKKYGINNEYGITLVSLDKNFKEKFEPYSASYSSRIKALKCLHDRGLKTWVSMEPYPTPNLVKQNLLQILNELSFIDNIVFGRLNYNAGASQTTYKNSKDFYERGARDVISFCEKNRIKYHIKHGTQKTDNKKTEKLFMENKDVKFNQIPQLVSL
jgi:DNA repair photolyase